MLFFTIMVLAACSEVIHNEYKFTGESEHWKAEYAYNGKEVWKDVDGTKTYSNEDSHEFVLTYKGTLEELSSLKKLQFSFETNSSSGRSVEEFSEPPNEVTFTLKGGSGGGAKVAEDEVIQVLVTWDDLEESFELHNPKR